MNIFETLALDPQRYTPEVQTRLFKEVENLFTGVPPDNLRDTIIEMYQIYIMHEHQYGFSSTFSDMACHIYSLLDTLRKIEFTIRECKQANVVTTQAKAT